jgi:hypothetical protein
MKVIVLLSIHFKVFKFLFALLLIATYFESASQIIYKDYLLSTQQITSIIQYDSLKEIYSDNPLHRPLIDRIEFRSETNEFRLDRQEYLLRLRTTNPLYNYNQSKLNKLSVHKIDLMKREELAANLYYKYKNIAKYESLKSEIEVIKEQKSILEKLIYYHKIIVQNPDKLSLEKLYDTNIKLSNIDLELSVVQFEFEQLQLEIFGDKKSGMVSGILPSIQSILEYTLQFNLNIKSIEKELLALKLESSRLEMIQNKANENKLLEHIQVQYQSDPENLLKENLSIGVGIRIPYIIKHNYLTDEYKIEQLKLRIEESEVSENKLIRVSNIKNKIELHSKTDKFIQEQIKNLSSRFNTDSLLRTGYSDTELLLEIKLQESKLRQKKGELQSEAMLQFVDFLYYTDHFAKQPDWYYLTIPFAKL